MRVAQPLQEGPGHSRPVAAPPGGAAPAREGGKPVAARLADDLAVPAPSPVHRLQADLAQLTLPEEAVAEQLYPGWLRLTFPVATSALMWAAILWGLGVFA